MARRRRPPAANDEDGEDWLATYADAITLLMAFFVMLVSFSKVELPLFEQVQAGIKEELGGQVDSDKPIFSLHSKVQQIVEDTDDVPPEAVDVGFDDEGVVIDFASGSFFEPGSAQLTEQAKLILGKLKRELEVPPYDLFFVDAEGHTDDVPISTEKFPSNWELSAARAAAVVRHFIDRGMEPNRLKAAGYADTKPKVPNKDIMEEPIPENRAINRRVTVRLHP
ncbi:MAG: flagellar motor protein MotB [Marivibrio sp.]|uniref:OmpA/MotB family protein n=1 Tax=Marivibrio sp. TaxID=2039719 RepID=UPI0032EF8831